MNEIVQHSPLETVDFTVLVTKTVRGVIQRQQLKNI